MTRARARNIPVALDASGKCLSAGLQGRPTIIEPNRAELEELTGRSLKSLRDIYSAGKEIQEKYSCSLVITLGGEGTLAILPERAYRIPVLPVKVVSTAGAGDGVLAGSGGGVIRWMAVGRRLAIGFSHGRGGLYAIGHGRLP